MGTDEFSPSPDLIAGEAPGGRDGTRRAGLGETDPKPPHPPHRRTTMSAHFLSCCPGRGSVRLMAGPPTCRLDAG